MYSYQAHLLQQKREEQEIERHNTVMKSSIRHVRTNKSLLCKHQQRLERIIRQASESKVVVKRSLDPICNISRSTDKSKNLGHEMIINTDRNERERVERGVIENRIRDVEPQRKSPSRYQFRERVKCREIQPEMRFTPHLPMERVVQAISRGNLYQLDPAQEAENLKTQKEVINRSSFMPSTLKKTFLSNEFSRHIFDDLHKRTYFKTLEQTALGAPGLNKYFENRKSTNTPNAEVFTPKTNRTSRERHATTDYLEKLSREILLKSKRSNAETLNK